jgi:hypothetical protein
MQSSDKWIAEAGISSGGRARVKCAFLSAVIFEETVDGTGNYVFVAWVFEGLNNQVK